MRSTGSVHCRRVRTTDCWQILSSRFNHWIDVHRTACIDAFIHSELVARQQIAEFWYDTRWYQVSQCPTKYDLTFLIFRCTQFNLGCIVLCFTTVAWFKVTKIMFRTSHSFNQHWPSETSWFSSFHIHFKTLKLIQWESPREKENRFSQN